MQMNMLKQINSQLVDLVKFKRICTDKEKELIDISIETLLEMKKKYSHKKKKNNEIDIGSIKQIPIDRYISFNQSGKAKCLWHAEKNPSMHYYKKSNKVKCFGCGKHADVIDVVMELNKCTFKEAIKILNTL